MPYPEIQNPFFMKKFLQIFALIAALVSAKQASAQTTYEIKKNGNFKALKFPNPCFDCTFSIAEGVTFTINNDVTLSSPVFDGGELVISGADVTFWTSGNSASTFNNTTVTIKGKSTITASAPVVAKGTQMTFKSTSKFIAQYGLTLDGSKMTYEDNSSFTATGSKVDLMNYSGMVAGDGPKSSKAYIMMNGAALNLFDNSYISIIGSNNYYFNWSAYSSKQNNKSHNTTWNNMNCGSKGLNDCAAPNVYGPASLTLGGLASSAVLPVKLSAFDVKLSGARVDLAWTTETELNASSFVIERSNDGLNWETAGAVAAKGNSNYVVNYSYSDAVKISGNISYRLKMIDQDGSFEYSPIRSLRVAVATSLNMNIYPNPATNYVVISSAGGASENLNIQLINMNGQVLKQTKGGGKVSMQVSEFNQGNYIVRVSDAKGVSQSFKLMIAK